MPSSRHASRHVTSSNESRRRRGRALDVVPRIFWATTAVVTGAAIGLVGLVAHDAPGHAASATQTSSSSSGRATATTPSSTTPSSTTPSSTTPSSRSKSNTTTTTLEPTTTTPVAVSGGTSR
jgi:hypothetical protein